MNNGSTTTGVANLPPFGRFLGTRISTIILRDPQLEKSGKQARAQLRSVPFLKEFGFSTVIHTDLWDNGLKLVDYTYLSSEEATERMEELSFPLVHVVTQEGITNHGEEDLVRNLYDRSIEEGGRYVLVTDTKSPRTATYTKKPGKGLDEESNAVSVKSYPTQFDEYIRDYLESPLSVNKTRNGFYHTAAVYHQQQGVRVTGVEELFDYGTAPSDSPVWDPLYYLLKDDLEGVIEGHSEHIREVLRSWTEHGPTQTIASRMFDLLDRLDFDRTALDEYRQQDPLHR
jgi:hypothetical protein